MTSDRDPILLAPQVCPPPRPQGTSKRVQTRWKDTCYIYERCNRALVALKELVRGVFTDQLLQHEVTVVGDSNSVLGKAASERILRIFQSRVPPADRPVDGAALERLRGSGTSWSPAPSQKSQHGPKGPRQEQQRVPQRGEIASAVVENISLPPAGTRPVPMGSISPTVKPFLENFRTEMLRPDATAVIRDSLQKPYVDPALLAPGVMLALCIRMALSGMLRRVVHKRGGVSVFTVVKKVLQRAGSSLQVILRLVFD